MPGERLVFDSRTESAANAPLELVEIDAADVRGVTLLEHDYPAPEPSSLTASSADTEGDPLIQNRYGNRQIPIRLRVVEPADAAATNLVVDPSFESATGLWTLLSGATLTRSATAARDGDMGLLIAAAASAGSGATSPSGASAWACAASTTYTAAVYVRAAAAADVGKTVALSLVEVTNAGATVGATTATVVLTAAWQRLSATRAFGATGVRFQVTITNNAATAFNFHADQVQMIAEATASNYFDGDTPGCSWAGAFAASTSSRPAPGGPRFYAIVADLEKKIDRINREGGTLKRVVPDGSPIVFDLLSATWHPTSDRRFIFAKRTEAEVTFTAKPFGRGATEIVGPDNDESTLPCVRFTTAGVQGNVPALGRLIITERQGVDQFRLIWGLRSRYYDPAATAALFYEAEGRTVLAGTAGALANASGGQAANHGNVPSVGFQAMLSTQATGGGAHLTHTGTYRLLARIQAGGAGALELTADYAEGDRIQRTATGKLYVPTSPGQFELADLGVVRLSRGLWEGRVLARRTTPTVSASLSVDCLFLVPVAEGAGQAYGRPALSAPSVLTLVDVGENAAANMTGNAPTVGTGVYAGGGDLDDFAYTGGGVIQRTFTGDSGGFQAGRYVWLPTTIAMSVVQVDFLATAGPSALRQGVVARAASSANAAIAYYRWPVAQLGTVALEHASGGGSTLYSVNAPALVAGSWYTLTLYIDTVGRFYVWLNPQNAQLGDPILTGTDTALATGGTRASGYCGLFDGNSSATPSTRQYDNLRAWAPSLDAALYANRQLEVRSSDYRRQDSAGAVWGAPAKDGDYLLVPPAGPDNRTTEIFVKASRSNPGDGGIDDIRAALAYTPRYLAVPG